MENLEFNNTSELTLNELRTTEGGMVSLIIAVAIVAYYAGYRAGQANCGCN